MADLWTDKPDAAAPETPLASRSRNSLTCAAAALFYAVVASMFFLPVWGLLKMHLIGDGGDCFEFYWNAWWIDHSLLAGRNPYWCDIQFAPTGLPLVLHTLSLIPSTLIALLGRSLTLPVAYNLMVIGLYPLAGLCLFSLARHITRDTAGALIGGLAFMISPFLSSKSVGHLNLECVGLLPLFTLALLRAIQSNGRWWRCCTAIVLFIILLSNIHTAIFAANVCLWSYVFFSFGTGSWSTWARRYARALAPAGVVALCWGAFIAYYSLRYRLEATPYRSLEWCPEPLCYVLPVFPTSQWRHWFASYWPIGNLELSVYLGWLVLPIAIAGWHMRRENTLVRLMAALFVVSLVLSLGHKLQWNRQVVHLGSQSLHLPMDLYRRIPVLGSIGQSGRYLVIGYMAIGVGVASAIGAVRSRYGNGAAHCFAGVLACLICLDYGFRPISVPLPACPIRAGAGMVMDPRLGNAKALYFQTIHERRLVGGYIARIPKWMYEAYRANTELGWFFQRTDRRLTAPSSDSLLPALERRHIDFVCVAPGSPDEAVLKQAGLRLIHADAEDVVFEVPTRSTPPLPESPGRLPSPPS